MKLRRGLDWLTLALVLPVCLNAIVYFGFITNYSGAFSRTSFTAHYSRGIYRSRVLGTEILLLTNNLIDRYLPVQRWVGLENTRRHLDPAASASFYLAYFVVNTVFFWLTAVALLAALSVANAWQLDAQSRPKALVLLLLIALSQFVVVPYDLLAYFLLLTGALISLLPVMPVTTAVLIIVIFLGTLTRETVVLNLSFLATVYVLRHGWRFHRDLLCLAAATLAFLMTYAVLRLRFGVTRNPSDLPTVWIGPRPLDLLMLLLFLSLLWLFAGDVWRPRAMRLFLLFASPYLLLVTLFGAWIELRLWVPVLLLLGILGALRAESKVDAPHGVG